MADDAGPEASDERGKGPDVSGITYNKVLEFYINDNNGDLDLTGIIAYGLYKRQKRDWLIKYKAANSGKTPSTIEVLSVVDSYLIDDQRITLRDRAADILSSYAETYVDALEPQIRANALANETLRQARDIENAIARNSGFWHQVGSGIIATMIWTFFVTALVIAAWLFGSDFVDGFQSLFRS